MAKWLGGCKGWVAARVGITANWKFFNQKLKMENGELVKKNKMIRSKEINGNSFDEKFRMSNHLMEMENCLIAKWLNG